MFFDRFRSSPFARALRAYGLERCSMAGETLCVGLKPHAEYNRRPIDRMPDAPISICLFEGPVQAGLMRALIGGPEARAVKTLVIGTSHDFKPVDTAYDMSEAVCALRGARLPALESLTLGEMEMLFNGHRLFGSVGDITHVFDAAPQLQSLDLRGLFALKAPVRHGLLRTLSVEVLSEVGIGDGPLNQSTVSHLLLSDLPLLTSCSLHLDDEPPEVPFTVPEEFFVRPRFPSMQSFSIDSLTPEAKARMEEWKMRRSLS